MLALSLTTVSTPLLSKISKASDVNTLRTLLGSLSFEEFKRV